MEHLFIRNNEKKLYCIYHEPEISDNNINGVVLCYPIGQEYIRCHKLFVYLAQKLALKGFHTLRFDYFGTGDSNGDFGSVRICHWIEDIGLAIKELKESCAISRIILVGVRLGATLAMLYAEKENIEELILWSPVFDGKRYLNELKTHHKKWIEGSFAKQKKKKRTIESLGYLYSRELCEDIKKLDIKDGKFNTESRVLIMDEDDIFLNVSNAKNISFKKIVNKEFWLKRDNENDKSLVPVFEIDTIFKWI